MEKEDMDLTYTFWADDCSISINSITSALVEDIDSLSQFINFFDGLNRIWSGSISSLKKVPKTSAINGETELLNLLDSKLNEWHVETKQVKSVVARYELLLNDVKQIRPISAIYLKEMKGWKTLKLKMQQTLIESTPQSGAISVASIEFTDNISLQEFIQWMQCTVPIQKRLFPIPKLPNEFFHASQLMETVKKKYPAAVQSVFQMEQLGQWLLDHEIITASNDVLNIQKRYANDVYYCWKPTQLRKESITAPMANDLMLEKWSKLQLQKLQLDVALKSSMQKLHELRRDYIITMNKCQEILLAKWPLQHPLVLAHLDTKYKKNMGSIGYYSSPTEPLTRFDESNVWDESFPLSCSLQQCKDANILPMILQHCKQFPKDEVCENWCLDLDLTHWHRLKKDIANHWLLHKPLHHQITTLDCSKAILLLKGWLLELPESIAPTIVTEHAVRSSCDLLSAFKTVTSTSSAYSIHLLSYVQLLRHFYSLSIESTSSIMLSSNETCFFPPIHYLFRSNHRVPTLCSSYTTLFLNSLQQLPAWMELEKSNSNPPNSTPTTPSKAVRLLPPTLTLSSPTNSTPTQFIPKPFKTLSREASPSQEKRTSRTSLLLLASPQQQPKCQETMTDR